MFTFYIYGIQYNSKIYYVGASMEPVTRLMLHYKYAIGKLGDILRNNDKRSVSLVIFDSLKHDQRFVSEDVRKIEQYWICKCIVEGEPLTNAIKTITSRYGTKKV